MPGNDVFLFSTRPVVMDEVLVKVIESEDWKVTPVSNLGSFKELAENGTGGSLVANLNANAIPAGKTGVEVDFQGKDLIKYAGELHIPRALISPIGPKQKFEGLLDDSPRDLLVINQHPKMAAARVCDWLVGLYPVRA